MWLLGGRETSFLLLKNKPPNKEHYPFTAREVTKCDIILGKGLSENVQKDTIAGRLVQSIWHDKKCPTFLFLIVTLPHSHPTPPHPTCALVSPENLVCKHMYALETNFVSPAYCCRRRRIGGEEFLLDWNMNHQSTRSTSNEKPFNFRIKLNKLERVKPVI
jgi:hypothetical protein